MLRYAHLIVIRTAVLLLGLIIAFGIATEATAAGLDNVIEGRIVRFECGDNCYLTIVDDLSKEHDGLCAARACQPWNDATEIPSYLVGKRVRVKANLGKQFDARGKLRGTVTRFRNVTLLNELNKRTADARSKTQPLSSVAQSKEFLAYCSGGFNSCIWVREISRDIVGSNHKGALFKSSLVFGESTNRGVSVASTYIDREPPVQIKWTASISVFAFCSKTTPVVMRDASPLQTTYLDIRKDGMVPGVVKEDFILYSFICHNRADSGINFVKNQDLLVDTYGYSSSEEAFERLLPINSPVDILK